MKIKSLTVTSPSTLDLELDVTCPVCVLCGEYSELALDLIRELIGDYGAKADPDYYDDGNFIILSDIEMDGKNFSTCYIRNIDFIGDHRIAVNFTPNSLDFSEDDTEEFIDKCHARDTDDSNVIYNYKVFTTTNDDRPLFVYCEDSDDISHVLDVLVTLGRQAFVAVNTENLEISNANIQTVFAG